MLFTLIGDGDGIFPLKPILGEFTTIERGLNKIKGDKTRGQTVEQQVRSQKRRRELDAKLRQIAPLSKKLRVGFRVHNPDQPNLDVSVDGEILKKLYEILHYGTFADYLQLSAKLSCRISDDAGTGQPTDFHKEFQLLPFLLNELPTATGSTSCTQYLATGIDLQLDPSIAQELSRQTWGCNFQLQLTVDKFDYGSISHMIPTAEQINGRILNQGSQWDFQLVDKEGGNFPCHQAFLEAWSPVFGQKFRTEASEEHLPDMPPESVNALLRFIYFGDVKDAVRNSAIAVDLYELGGRYMIRDLVAIMRELFIRKSRAWLGLENANRLMVTLSTRLWENDGELLASVRRVFA